MAITFLEIVFDGKVVLDTARHAMATDWVSAYKLYWSG
jgi:hypothetical protein